MEIKNESIYLFFKIVKDTMKILNLKSKAYNCMYYVKEHYVREHYDIL